MLKIYQARVLALGTAFAVLCGVSTAVHASNGTQLSVIASVDNPNAACSGAMTTVNVTVTSTGSAAPASVYVSTDGVNFTNAGSITDWAGSGRTKTADGILQVQIPQSGSTTIEVRVIQPGSNGNDLKKASADVTVAPQCGTGDGNGVTATP